MLDQHFIQAIRTCRSDQAVLGFLEDVLTAGELRDIMKRWAVALELARVEAGVSKKLQRQIAKDVGCTEKVVGNVKHAVFGNRNSGVAKLIALKQAAPSLKPRRQAKDTKSKPR